LGFTHYTNSESTKKLPQARWDMFVEAVKHVYAELPKQSLSAGAYYEDDPLKICGGQGDGEPVFDSEQIWFNGDESQDLNHEIFQLCIFPSPFSFCKTARKPYDLMVCATLLLYWHFFKEHGITISSDGDLEDWKPAIELVKQVTGLHISWQENIDEIA